MKVINDILNNGAVFLDGRFPCSLIRTGNKIVVQIGDRVNKVSFEGVEVILKYNIQNPIYSSINMSTLLMKVSHDGKILVSSSKELVEIPEDVRSTNGVTIKSFKETGVITMSILLPALSLIGTDVNLITLLKNRLIADSETQETIKFKIETTATVFTNVGKIPYDDKSIIEI